MSNIIDITVPLREGMVRWPGSTSFSHSWAKKIDYGDGVNISSISCGLHVGTHVDAPLHYISGGASVDRLDLDVLCGEAQVVEFPGVAAVTAEILSSAGIWPETERLLLRTRNSSFWEGDLFQPDFTALTKDAAQFLVRRGIRLLGVDYLSVQRYNDPPDVHRLLLADGIVLLEGLNFSLVAPGGYELICLPLRITGAEGAPARAILRDLRKAPCPRP